MIFAVLISVGILVFITLDPLITHVAPLHLISFTLFPLLFLLVDIKSFAVLCKEGPKVYILLFRQLARVAASLKYRQMSRMVAKGGSRMKFRLNSRMGIIISTFAAILLMKCPSGYLTSRSHALMSGSSSLSLSDQMSSSRILSAAE